MKHATLKSARLQRVLKVLSEKGEHSTWDIMRRAKVCAVNSCIAELRELGARIEVRRAIEGPEKERRWYYTMTKGPRHD